MLGFYLYGVDMSFTTKRIHGKEYEYFEFYLGKRKRSVLLGVKGGSIDEQAKKTVLIVLKAKIFAYFRKLWQFFSRCSVSKTCQCSYHGCVDVSEIEDMKRIVNRLKEQLEEPHIIRSLLKGDVNELRRILSKISVKRSALPLITVVYRDKQGFHQIKDVCVTCLYRRLWNYGVVGYNREPKRLGILFLNDDIQFSF